MAASMPRACAIMHLLVLAECVRLDSELLPGLLRAKIPWWDCLACNGSEVVSDDGEEYYVPNRAQPQVKLPRLEPMWAQVLHTAMKNEACQELQKWADEYQSELNTRTAMNAFGGVAGAVGVASAGVAALHVGSKVLQHGVAQAGNVANAWDVVDAAKESGELLTGMIWDAQKEFDIIREQHKTDGVWTTAKRVQMGASLVVMGGAAAVGTGGAGLPAFLAAAGAGLSAVGMGAALHNQSAFVEEDRQDFNDFLKNFEYHCKNRGVPLSLQPLREATVKFGRLGNSLIILRIPSQAIPSRPQTGLLYVPRFYHQPHPHRPITRTVQLRSSPASLVGKWVTFDIDGKTFATRVPQHATRGPWDVNLVA